MATLPMSVPGAAVVVKTLGELSVKVVEVHTQETQQHGLSTLATERNFSQAGDAKAEEDIEDQYKRVLRHNYQFARHYHIKAMLTGRAPLCQEVGRSIGVCQQNVNFIPPFTLRMWRLTVAYLETHTCVQVCQEMLGCLAVPQ